MGDKNQDLNLEIWKDWDVNIKFSCANNEYSEKNKWIKDVTVTPKSNKCIYLTVFLFCLLSATSKSLCSIGYR